MNQGKLWTVVHPTIGIPLLLGSVAVTSLIVHAAILTHTDWYPAFYNHGVKRTAMIEGNTAVAAAAPASQAYHVALAPGADTASTKLAFAGMK